MRDDHWWLDTATCKLAVANNRLAKQGLRNNLCKTQFASTSSIKSYLQQGLRSRIFKERVWQCNLHRHTFHKLFFANSIITMRYAAVSLKASTGVTNMVPSGADYEAVGKESRGQPPRAKRARRPSEASQGQNNNVHITQATQY